MWTARAETRSPRADRGGDGGSPGFSCVTQRDIGIRRRDRRHQHAVVGVRRRGRTKRPSPPPRRAARDKRPQPGPTPTSPPPDRGAMNSRREAKRAFIVFEQVEICAADRNVERARPARRTRSGWARAPGRARWRCAGTGRRRNSHAAGGSRQDRDRGRPPHAPARTRRVRSAASETPDTTSGSAMVSATLHGAD